MVRNPAEYLTNERRKQILRDNMHKLMKRKGWIQADLVRASGLNKAAVSSYMIGKNLPTEESLESMATALGVGPGDLLPTHVLRTSETGVLSLTTAEPSEAWKLLSVEGQPDQAVLEIRKTVSHKLALKILSMIQEEDEATRGPADAD